MRFEDFLKEGKVVKGSPDLQKAKALIKMSKATLESAELTPLNETTASAILCTAYSALRQILEAITLTEGFKIYSHEAYTYYLKKKDDALRAEKFDRFRKLRNGAEYYGRPISKEVTEAAKKEIGKLCKELMNKYL